MKTSTVFALAVSGSSAASVAFAHSPHYAHAPLVARGLALIDAHHHLPGGMKRLLAKRQLVESLVDGLLGGSEDGSADATSAATGASAAASATTGSSADPAVTTATADAQSSTQSTVVQASSAIDQPDQQSSATSATSAAVPETSVAATSAETAPVSESASSSATENSSSSSSEPATSVAQSTTVTQIVSASTGSSASSISGVSSISSTASASSASSSASLASDTDSSSSSGGISKNVLIPIIVVASVVALIGAIWTIVRKTKFSPSRRFEAKLAPIDYAPDAVRPADDDDRDAILAHGRNGSALSVGAQSPYGGGACGGHYAESLARSDSGKTSVRGGVPMSESMHTFASIPYNGNAYVQAPYGSPAFNAVQPGYPHEPAYSYADVHRTGSYSRPTPEPHMATMRAASPALYRMPTSRSGGMLSPAPHAVGPTIEYNPVVRY